MEQHHIPKCLLYRELLYDKKHQSQPKKKKQYNNTIKTNLHQCKIKSKDLEESAAEWSYWVYQISAKFKEAQCQ